MAPCFPQNRPGHGREKRYATRPMIRFSAPILVGLLLMTGCTNTCQSPRTDPFFGRTTIPPPATGAASGRTPDPYYQTPPGIAVPAVQPGATVGTVAPSAPASSGWAPPITSGTNTTSPNRSAPRPSSTYPSGPMPAPSLPANPSTPAYQPQPSTPVNPPSPSYQPQPSTTPPNTAPPTGPGSRYGNAPSTGTDRYRGVSLQGTGMVGRKPAVRTLQPRGTAAAETPVVEIGDLPR